MTPIKGRSTIARVTKLFRITSMAAQDEGWAETLELNPCGAVYMATRCLLERMVKEAATTAA